MVLDELLDRLRGQDAADYISELEDDAHVTMTTDIAVSTYNGPFTSIHRPIDEGVVYAEMDDGDRSYREEVGSVLLETDGSYLTEQQAETHDELESTAEELVDEWTGMLEEAGLDYARE